MLSVTNEAAQVMDAARQQQDVPAEYGLRVFAQETPEGTAVQLAFAPEPEEGDEVAESEGQRLFVAPELVEPLADATLDAQDTPEGTGLILKQPEQS